MSSFTRSLTIILLGVAFVLTSFTLNKAYHQKIEQINVVGRANIEKAVIWQTANAIMNSGILDDIANFTVDYQYLGDYPFGNGLRNYRAFRDKILADYEGLINITELMNTSFALFIDNKLIYINGGTVKYTGRSAPFSIVAVYSPVYFGFIVLPNWELYAVYNLSNAKFYDERYGYIVNATKLSPSPSNLARGYCIFVNGTVSSGKICYAREMTLPYVVKTPNKWGGYNFTIYWGELG